MTIKVPPRIVLIAGPTASGKSALALRVAERLNGAVINADSMQCYRDLRILTARPTAEDEVRVDHCLYGTVDGATNHSVSLWLVEAETTIRRLWRENRVPVIVGGTGLYLKALVEGLSAIPPVTEAVRAEVRARFQGLAPQRIHDALATLDPIMAARLRPSDPQRLIRAYEVVVATGQSLASFQKERAPSVLKGSLVASVTLQVPDLSLWRSLQSRTAEMLRFGAIAEVADLVARHLPPAHPILRAIGVAAIQRHLAGTMSLDEVAEEMNLESRRYIKRQRTFFRTQLHFKETDAGSVERIIFERLQSA